MIKIKHRIRWFVWAGDEKMPRRATMRGQWGYDAECSCGWETRTGGATRGYVASEIAFHKAFPYMGDFKTIAN